MLLNMYITMIPVILAGILNMVVTKTALYQKRTHPMDFGRCCRDGRRVFGENKTWFGFFSMILICMLVQMFWGYLCSRCGFGGRNELYRFYDNGWLLNLAAGAAFGFAYMIMELPNSFVKRRLDIQPGRTDRGVKGILFFVIDQIDSLVGVIFVLHLFSPMSIGKYLAYILVGGITHISVNLLLYLLRIRKNL